VGAIKGLNLVPLILGGRGQQNGGEENRPTAWEGGDAGWNLLMLVVVCFIKQNCQNVLTS
jgi:hypothetical protein